MNYPNQEKILQEYQRIAHTVLPRMYKKYSAKLVTSMIDDGSQELSRLISDIPYIGKNNIWQFNLDTAIMDLALYRALKRQGFSLAESVQITYDLFESYLLSFAQPLRWVYRLYYFCPVNTNKLRKGAQASQQRHYSEDWVFTFIERNDAYDFGVDINECAILKFFQAHGASELTPHLCSLDHLMGKLFGLGFSRKGTLAGGATVCDCRWKRGVETTGGPVLQGTVY